MYVRGMIVRNISEYLKEMYAMEISATEISHITDKPRRRAIIPLMNELRYRPLEAVYAFVSLDSMHYNVRREGKKDLIGIYLSENEGAKFLGAAWRLSVLTNLKQRGVEDY